MKSVFRKIEIKNGLKINKVNKIILKSNICTPLYFAIIKIKEAQIGIVKLMKFF